MKEHPLLKKIVTRFHGGDKGATAKNLGMSASNFSHYFNCKRILKEFHIIRIYQKYGKANGKIAGLSEKDILTNLKEQ